MIQPEIVVHLNADPITTHDLTKLVLEQMKRELRKLEEPTHQHAFEYLRQEEHTDTGEIQDVLFCSGCCEYRFRRVGPFRPVAGWQESLSDEGRAWIRLS